MATVIDSLIVTLGLDPKGFQKGQKEAAAAFLKTKNEAVSSGKAIEEASNKVANSINRMAREVIALFAVIAGSRSLTEMITKLTTADAELGRFSRNLAESPQRMAAWGMAAERMGGSVQETASTMERMGQALYDLHTNAKMLPTELYRLTAAVGMNLDTEHGVDKFMLNIADAANRLAKTDPARAHFLLKGAGIDDATANAMIKYGAAFDSYLKSLERNAPSAKAIEAAQKLQESWFTLQQQALALSNVLYEKLGPFLTDIIGKMAAWIDKNQDWITSGIVDAVKKFAQFLEGINWAAVGQGFKDFADGANSAVHAIGGLSTATEILFGLWLGSKFLAVLANMRLLATGGGAAAGGGLMALFGRLSPFLAMLTLSGDKAGGGGVTQAQLDADTDAYTKLKGYDRSGPRNPRGRDSGEIARDRSLADFTNTTVDGKPVNKANPMPVEITGTPSADGGGWLGKVGSAIGGFFSGLTSGGGGGAASAGAMAGSLAKGASSVPNITGMTDDEKNTLGLIMKYESGGRNTMNYAGRAQNLDAATAKGYTAQGYYQILNSNWRRLAPKLGISAPNAMAASLDDQTRVALALMRESGTGNWANFNPALKRALARGENAGPWAGRAGKGFPTGAGASAKLSSVANDNRVTTSNSSAETHIGTINVNAPNATDADGIAGGISDSMKRVGSATAANYGPR